ncbi:MAG: HAMP domain-containing histidine kinase [Prevotellaceae bacterium]|jgi:signal transduction histidine kinase|nr:HAMP domain-containing histidine kinase [Prevotellaceae bacterium]
MKLVNHLTLRLSVTFTVVLFVWSIAYFFLQITEIYDGIDEGLNNLKQEFVIKANATEDFVADMAKHNPLNIIVAEIPATAADRHTLNKDVYATTTIYFPTEQEEEEVRMLTTTFRCARDEKCYRLQIFTSTVESDDLIANMLYLLGGLWAALALMLAVLSRRIIFKSSKPFRKLLAELNNFQLDKSKMIPLEPTNIDEYRELNKSVEKLLQENIQTFVNQKNFIENMSHELQTPLAIAINKMELLLNGGALSREQMEEINAALQQLNRMKKLNSGLLLLAKIKNMQFADELLSLNDIFGEAAHNFEHLIEHKKITLRVETNARITVRMNADLAYIMATNLLKNAISYNTPGGEIAITFNPGAIAIANDGHPPPNGNRNIFERYFSAAAGKQSFGLGLSIVQSIADKYRFSINYQYANNHIITLIFGK